MTAFCPYCETKIRDDEQRWSDREPVEGWHYKCADRVGLTAQSRAAFEKKIESPTGD